ncbi:slipin family protein [Emticicia sp. CRIBPO]|uniref:slipin family protein n=1 Tax=Emticicia sp. CRIBPO TaxID=2683258 RepID=UPI00141212CD|nr:slipin family protein [Emticicia sp. CRIBPO]NBA85573.1 slipin family protein [Emticicia sp. CRIBPO]
MKRITININQKGLVFKNGALRKVLGEGKYWINWGEQALIYDLSKPFITDIDINVLLQHEDMTKSVDVVDVADHELVLVYQEDKFRQVLTSGKYLFWKGLVRYGFIKVNTANIEIETSVDKNLLEKAPLNAFVRVQKVESFEKALLIIDGKLDKVLDGGTYTWWKNSISIQVAKADMRQLTMEVAGQEILTRDKAQLRINFSVQYKVEDIVKALFENKEYEKQLYMLMQLALREFVGRMTLDELMDSKDKIATYIMENTVDKAKALGVQLLYCGAKDIILPGEVKAIMNQVLIAEKKAQANIITRREETASTRSLLNTAKLLEENEMLFKLKEMEYVEKIAEKINNITLSGGGQIVDQLKQIFIK